MLLTRGILRGAMDRTRWLNLSTCIDREKVNCLRSWPRSSISTMSSWYSFMRTHMNKKSILKDCSSSNKFKVTVYPLRSKQSQWQGQLAEEGRTELRGVGKPNPNASESGGQSQCIDPETSGQSRMYSILNIVNGLNMNKILRDFEASRTDQKLKTLQLEVDHLQ